MQKRHLPALKLALLLAGAAVLVAGPALAATEDPVAERQPLMRQALKALQIAKTKLENATHDKGGHRIKALAQTKLAIAQVKLGIGYDNRNEFAPSDLRLERQPLMSAAKARLQEARALLQKATHDKGGHRVKALHHVDLAIAQVNKGIRHDNRN